MLQVKFRAFDKFTNKMICEGFHIFGEVHTFSLIEQYLHDNPDSNKHTFLRFNDIVVMQYSHQQDKNKKDIYEGDVIEIINQENKTVRFVCEFGIAERENKDGVLISIPSFYFKNISTDFKAFPIVKNYLGKHDLEIMEVIGNIYENHELLK